MNKILSDIYVLRVPKRNKNKEKQQSPGRRAELFLNVFEEETTLGLEAPENSIGFRQCGTIIIAQAVSRQIFGCIFGRKSSLK